jgi:vacuolar-type H+-ATPase subunit E/Vma4
MKEVSDVVLDRIRQQAEAILHAAREEAELDKARRRREERIETERRQRLAEADVKAARIVAQGTMQARDTVAAAKAAVMDEIVARGRTELEALPTARASLARLIADAIDGLGGVGKVIVGVSAGDLAIAREILAEDMRLAPLVSEVTARPIGGGVVVESEDGALAVDNSHAARLEMLIPRIIVRFGRELF